MAASAKGVYRTMGKKSIQIVGDDATELEGETFMPISTEAEDTQQASPAVEDVKATPKRLPVAESEEPIDQRTDATTQSAAQKPKDLTMDPDFRAWQAKTDKQLQDERSARQAAERRFEELQKQQYDARLSYLDGALRSDNFESVDARMLAIQEYAALDAQKQFAQLQTWGSHMQRRIAEEGLDPVDPRFSKNYQGEIGAAQFEIDVLAAKRDKLTKENEQLMAQMSPENIAKIVQRELAKATHQSGLDLIDTGEPAAPVMAGSDEIEHDIIELNQRRMSPEAFRKKWGNMTK